MSPRLHLYFHTLVPVFKARVNMVSATYPATQILYDNVSLGAFGDIEFDMTLTLGTTEGADDLGRTRVNKPATSTLINIARSAQGFEDGTLILENNAYITVWDDFRVWAKIPYFDLDAGIDFKDGDVPPGTFTTNIPPVANCGPGFADYISAGVITVEFPKDGVNQSYAMADGATIDTYAWDVKDGTITVGTASSPVITATFPAGFRHVSLTVVDSNGVPHTSRCPVLAVDPEDDVTYKTFQISQRFDLSGQTMDVDIYDDLSRTNYPDGTLVMFWWDGPATPGDRTHMKFVGWVDNESYSVNRVKKGLTRHTSLHCVDLAGRLKLLPGFPQALERTVEEELGQWSYMPTLDINKSLHYLLFWHSTAVNLADFILPVYGSDYVAMRLDAGGASLFDQVNGQAQKIVPDHYLTCNSQGQLSVIRDWRLLDVGDRPAAAPIISESYWNDMQIDYSRQPKVHVLRSAAIQASTSFIDVDGEETLPLVFSIAPGDAAAFSQGTSERQENEGLALSQEELNICEGHRYAMLNSRFGPFKFSDPSGLAFWNYEPALFNRVQLNISALRAAQRGLNFTEASGLVKDMMVNYRTSKKGTVVKPTITWEKETSGYPAITHIPEDSEPIDYVPPLPTTPPDDGLLEGTELLAGIDIDGNVYRTTDFQTPSGSGGPTWTQHSTGITEVIFSSVVDPFSPGYIEGAGAISAWVATEEAIYKLSDLFGTLVVNTVHTFAEPVVAASFHWRTIQASFGAFFAEGDNPWLLCISYYGDTTGHEGTWATWSLDGGVTWETEVQISTEYDSGTPARFSPIGVYTSPKTPGLAYTAAHVDVETGPMPRWGVWDDEASTWTLGALAPAASMDNDTTNTGGAVTSSRKFLVLAPPADAVRVEYELTWQIEKLGTGSILTDLAIEDELQTTQTNDHDGVNRTATETVVVTGTASLTSGTDWPWNRDVVVATPPTGPEGLRFNLYSSADATSPPTAVHCNTQISVRVTEIELDGGIIYNPSATSVEGKVTEDWGETWDTSVMAEPGNAFAGTIHLPWHDNADEGIAYFGELDTETNRQFRLKRRQAGVTLDISPTDGSILYGVNRGPFGVRAHDSNRQYLLASVIGNDTSADPDDDMHAVYVSSDEGDNWTEVVAPIADTGAPAGRPAFEAAFGGDSEQVIFIWGPAEYIAYSNDMGATVDDRSGNLGTFTPSGFIGIAGGPTP